MEQEETYVGIDVAKAQVDVAIRPADDRWRVSHDEAGIRQLVSRLKTLEPVMVLLEASGGLELPLVAVLAAEAVPVVVVNPRQVRDFAKATGKLAKTDSLPFLQLRTIFRNRPIHKLLAKRAPTSLFSCHFQVHNSPRLVFLVKGGEISYHVGGAKLYHSSRLDPRCCS